MSTAIRQPAVAGRFYPANAQRLRAEVETFTTARAKPEQEGREPSIRAIGCIAPHAGYVYSGAVAGALYRRLDLPHKFVIDADTAAVLKEAAPQLSEDAEAHRYEHALEVQLPFLQVLQPDFQFLPIAVGTSKFEWLSAVGEAIAKVLASRAGRTMIIASSDMNHYESDNVTRIKDRRAIDQVLALNPRGLYDTVRDGHISMCGYGPATIMLTAARQLGATAAELIGYATSAEVSGDHDMVVGYAGIAVY